MSTPATQPSLTDILANSGGFRLLIPSYRQALQKVIQSGDLAQQKSLATILRREKSSDLQNVYFTESVLQDFVEKNLGLPPNSPQLLTEFRIKAKILVSNFLFFGETEKSEILPYIDSLNLEGVKKLIALYKLGHHKQSQYLETFAEKDPRSALKMEIKLNSIPI